MKRILVVESDSAEAARLAEVLSTTGYTVETATTGALAIASLENSQPNLVILASDLESDQGLDLCRKVVSQWDDLPVLIRGALIRASDIIQSLAAGAVGFLDRALSAKRLVARVDQALQLTKTGNGNGNGNGSAIEDEISIELEGETVPIHASRERLVHVLVSSLEDLDRANQRHEAELARRRGAEQQLQDSQALYASLVENLPLNLLCKGMDGRLIFANQRYCKARGLTLEEMIGKNDHDMFPKELADKYVADDQAIMDSREVMEDIESHIDVNGERRFVHVLKTPVYDAKQNVIGIQGIFWDVTARRLAEEAFERERYLLTTLLDNIPNDIFFKDADGRYLRINQSMATRLRLENPDEAVGRTVADFFSAEYADRVRASDEQTLESGHAIVDQEQLVRWPNGAEEWVSITRMPLRNPDQEITGTFGLTHNITDQKLAQVAMQEAKDAAEAASESKSNFLANMSHEIRTPMNAIIGMTELVLDTSLEQSQREYLSMVQESGESLLGVINDILDFSKIEAGRLELEHRPFQLREALGDTLKSLAVRANDDEIELVCHIAPDVPEFLVGDSGRLRQVVVNLVANAIKFTEQGEILVDVVVNEDDQSLMEWPGDSSQEAPVQLHVSVTDTGIGISKSKLQRIFDAFEQVDTSMTRRYEGTGLGLAISSRLVELMHGRIWVESEIQEGSTFHFTASFGQAPEHILNLQTRNTTSLEGRRVLVVDDNATNRRILEELLRNWLILPTLVDSGAAAINAIESATQSGQPFDMLLTDANMPEMDGFTLVDTLNNRKDLDCPIIMMLTSSGRMGDIARSTELGIGWYLMKPIKQSELFDAIVEALGIERPEDEGSSFGENAPAHSRRLKILLAEDSRVNQKLAIALLEKWGHQVTVANNGRIAVELFEAEKFDVVLMDVQMPEMDGMQATKTIRNIESHNSTVGDSASQQLHTPIIAMTAHALKGDEERCLSVGMDAYISKPIRAPLLFEKLSIWGDVYPVVAETLSQDPPTPEAEIPDSPDANPRIQQELTQMIDWNVALEVAAGDAELLDILLVAILEETPEQMRNLDAAVAATDVDSARRAAHTVLGNMRTVMAEQAMEQAAAVELLARETDFDAISEPIEQLRNTVTSVLAEITHHRESQ
jgi:two-component system, sensor histidine kinase and response regulator